MVAGRTGSPWTDTLIREATEQFRFLVTDHGFRQTDHIHQWGTTVEFRGERLTLSLMHGDREFDFAAEIKYGKFARKNPKALWSVLEALGVSSGPVTTQTMVDEDRLRTLVATTAALVERHWALINRDPTEALFRAVEKIEARYARRVRKQ